MKKRKSDGIPNKSTYIPHPKIFKDGGKKALNSKGAVNNSSYESSVGANYHQPLTKKQQQETERISKEVSKNFIQGADVVSDVMQLGNFIPHPIGQAIGKIGNVAGAAIDAYQAVDDFSQGDYTGAAINAASVTLPSFLGNKGFKRNAKYLSKTNVFKDVNNRTMFNNVVKQTRHQTPEQLLANRALLGSLGAETIYDSQSEYKKGCEYTPKQEEMLSKIHQEFMYGNPSAIRMMNLNPPSYPITGNEVDNWGRSYVEHKGKQGTHLMSSTDNFAVPYIQQNDKGQMYFNPDASPRDREAMRFNTEQEANYFGEHYKEVAPMMQQSKQDEQMKKTMKKGGTWNGDMSTFFEQGGYVHPGFVAAAVNDAIQNMLNSKPKKGSSVKNQFRNVSEFMNGGMFEDGGKVKHNFFDGDGNTDNQNEFNGGASAPEGAFNEQTGQANYTPTPEFSPDKTGVVNPEAEASDAQNYNASQQKPYYYSQQSTIPKEEEAPPQKKGLGYAALGAIGAVSGINYVAKKRQQRQESEQDRMAKTTSSLYGNAMNPNGLKGDYVATGTAYGQFRPDQQTVYRQGMHYAKNGGMYQEGNEYDLSETQIKLLEKMGYKLQY